MHPRELNPIFESLNGVQKKVIEAILQCYLEDIHDAERKPVLKSDQIIAVLEAMDNKKPLIPEEIAEFKRQDVWESIETVREILNHPYPENRAESYPYVGQEEGFSMFHLNAEDCVKLLDHKMTLSTEHQIVTHGIPKTVYDVIYKNGRQIKADHVIRLTYNAEGIDDFVGKEPVGKLSLTNLDDATTHYVRKKSVVDYIKLLVKNAIDLQEAKEQTLLSASHHTLFKPDTRIYDKFALNALLGHVVRGEQSEAEAIIKTNPELLFITGRVRDLGGNTFINYSPCQLARYVHDLDMLKMMKPYLKQVENGEKQFIAILKEAKNEEVKEQKTYNFDPLVAAIDAIKSGHFRTKIEAEEIFRRDFWPKKIEKEKSYNIENLRIAYKIYIDHYDRWSHDQRQFFYHRIIGFIQRSLPACYAQAFCQGIYYVAEAKQPLERNLILLNEPFYSIDSSLGIDTAVYAYNLAAHLSSRETGLQYYPTEGRAVVTAERDVWTGGYLENYVRQKQQGYDSLCDHLTMALTEKSPKLINS